MSDISPLGGPSHNDMEIYRKDFARGSKVLKDAAEEYLQTTEEHKKAQLEKSMSEALDAMNEILNNVLHKKGEKYEKKISDDYNNFISNATEENKDQLNKDINNIEKSL